MPCRLQVRNASDVTSFGVRLNQVASDRIVSASPDTGNLVPTYNDRGIVHAQCCHVPPLLVTAFPAKMLGPVDGLIR